MTRRKSTAFYSEAVVRSRYVKKLLSKISQNSRESTCARQSIFFDKVVGLRRIASVARLKFAEWRSAFIRNFIFFIKSFKVGLSPSKKICVICLIESPFKMMKNAFYFILIALFVLKIFTFLSPLFGHLGKTA